MNRAVVNVATGSHYLKGQARLAAALAQEACEFVCWSDALPPGSPSHRDCPYGFKPFSLLWAREQGYESVIWADACIVPNGPLEPLWERIERDGYWISRNGYQNSEWTCNEAYPLLGVTREENEQIPHVVATAFGLNLASEIGARCFVKYLRCALDGAFNGPWTGGVGVQHRHDQTALSVIAWRLGMELTDPPAWFSYRGGENETTVLVADGAYQ